MGLETLGKDIVRTLTEPHPQKVELLNQPDPWAIAIGLEPDPTTKPEPKPTTTT